MVICHVTITCITWSSEKPQDYLDRIKILQEFHEKGVLRNTLVYNLLIMQQCIFYIGMWVRGFSHIIENINIVKMIFPPKLDVYISLPN